MAQRPKQLTPNASPAHFWGAEMRARRVNRGLSLADLGRLIHRDRSYLAKVERGERTPTAEIARDCDRALGDDGTLIRLHAMIVATEQGRDVASPPLDVAPGGPHVANPGPHVASEPQLLAPGGQATAPWGAGEETDEVSVPARAPDGKVVFVSLSRRLFLGAVGSSAAAAVAGSARNPAASAARLGLPAAPELHPAEHFEQLRRTMIDSDNLFGPERVIPVVRAQIDLIRELRRGMRGSDERSLIAMQAKYAEFVGWLYHDHGDLDEADRWTARALEWSHGAQDHDLTVFILARRAQVAGDLQDAGQTIDMGTTARRMAGDRSRLAAVAATYTAHGYALEGDLDGTQRAYDEARNLLDTTEFNPASPWGVWLDEPYIEVARHRSLALLGEYTRAAEGFVTMIAALPAGFRRDRGVYLARAANAYAGAEDLDHAAELGMQALTIGLETKSGRILTELAQLDDVLDGRATAGVSQFRQAMAETIGRQA